MKNRIPTVKLKNVRFTFVHLAEPHGFEENTPKYSVNVLIRKNDKPNIETIQENYEAALRKGIEDFGQRFNSQATPIKRPKGSDRGLLIDCDEDDRYAGNAEYAGCYMLAIKSITPPQCMSIACGKRILEKEEIADEIYSGCYGHVSFNFYPYAKGKGGISAGLANVLKTKDGEYLGGRRSALADFDDDFDEAFGDGDDLL